MNESLQSNDGMMGKKHKSGRYSISRLLNRSAIIRKVQRKFLGEKNKAGKRPTEREVSDDDECTRVDESTQRPLPCPCDTNGSNGTSIESAILPSSPTRVVVHSTDVWLEQIDGKDVSKSWRSLASELSLNPKIAAQFRLSRRTHLGEDTFVLEFALPTSDQKAGVPPGKHVIVSATIDGKKLSRTYTPISSGFEKGCLELLVTALRPNKLYPGGGKMTQYLENLKIGDHVDFQGPVGDFEYVSNGKFLLDGMQKIANHFNMIATGVRISSCIQIITHILDDRSDRTTISLVYVVAKEEDILMRTRLERWAREEEDKFKLHYVLTEKWPGGWTHSTGKLRKAIFAAHFAEPDEGVYNLLCAPQPTLEERCIPALMNLGHAPDRQFSL
eukprot:scaffold442_cov110-Cylindrotheca_fusiformis.AAC.16